MKRFAISTVAAVLLGCGAGPAPRDATAPRDVTAPAGVAGASDASSSVALAGNHDWLTGNVADLGYTPLIEARPPKREGTSSLAVAEEPGPPAAPECIRVAAQLPGGSSVACAVAPGGAAWFVETRATDSEDAGRKGTWRVGHASGKALRFGAEEPFTVEGGQYSVNIPPVVVRFGDVTGDGVADAAFAGYELVNTSDVGERFLAIYALSATGLARVPPTRDTAAFALLDCNADGLPEVYYDPYRAPGADVGIHFTFNNRRSAAAWSLLAEGTAKGFRVDGGLAAAHARALCADAGKGPLAERDPGTWPHAIHCMRLSGVGAGDIERELSAACSHAAPPLADYCQRNGARFLQMARTSLPISLGADGATAPGCLLPPAERD